MATTGQAAARTGGGFKEDAQQASKQHWQVVVWRARMTAAAELRARPWRACT